MENEMQCTLNINMAKEKRAILSYIKNIGLEKNGKIFGGMVRDEIICNHYKHEFTTKYKLINSKNNQALPSFSKDFWDVTYDPETIGRTLVAKDIDIFFPKNSDGKAFITKISNTFSNNNIQIDDISINNPYVSHEYGHLIEQKKISFTYIIGKTYTFRGFKLKISIDCLLIKEMSTHYYDTTIEPPFKNADMLCNLFIETKDGIRLSTNTGTIIDNLSIYERNKVQLNVMRDIINFKTELITDAELSDLPELTDMEYNKSRELTLMRRVIKMTTPMINRPSWNITNLPYKIDKIIKNPDDGSAETCIICCCELNIDDNVTSIYSKSSKGEIIKSSCTLHLECMNNYLSSLFYTDAEYICCPYKSQIKFYGISPDYIRLLL